MSTSSSVRSFQLRKFLTFWKILKNLHYHSVLPSASLQEEKSVLISLKVRGDLLRAFKAKAQLEGVRYQTQIKTLMEKWLKDSSDLSDHDENSFFSKTE